MKHVTITREKPTTDQGTKGLWVIDEQPEHGWKTLELPDRHNAPRLSCIPNGTYMCELGPTSHLWSPREDGRLFHVLDVPGRSAIEIHAATWAGDVKLGFHTDLLGCIAVGASFGMLTPPDTAKPQLAILSSRATLKQIMHILGDEPFQLTIEEGE